MPSKEFYAPPIAFGSWQKLFSHLGEPNRFTIVATPLGDTVITGEVRYYDIKNDLRVQSFPNEITIEVGKCVCDVDLRFRGVPTGSAVDVKY